MNLTASNRVLLSIIFSSTLLSACGGGGGDSGGSSSSTAASTPDKPPAEVTKPSAPNDAKVNPPTLIEPPTLAKPPSALSAKQQEISAGLAVDNFLSMEREKCNIGGYTYDEQLAEISYQHANFLDHLFSNANLTGVNVHQENRYQGFEAISGANNPFFTGVTLQDRMNFANYSKSYLASENIARRSISNYRGPQPAIDEVGISLAKGLLSAPYHLRSLVDPTLVNSGSTVATYTPAGADPATSFAYILVATAASKNPAAATIPTGITTYPCGATTDTNTALYGESPDPTKGTGRDLRKDPIGQPIHIKMWSASTIKVSNIEIKDVERNLRVPVELVDASNDPYKGTAYKLPNNEAFIMPITDTFKSCETGSRANCGLYGNSKYSVSFEVLVDNKELMTKQFTFSTGAVNY